MFFNNLTIFPLPTLHFWVLVATLAFARQIVVKEAGKGKPAAAQDVAATGDQSVSIMRNTHFGDSLTINLFLRRKHTTKA